METARGTRKALPNYLLDDYVPSSDSKAAPPNGDKGRHISAEGYQQQFGDESALAHGTAGAGESSDNTGGPGGLLPRRKKKLRQACVYCRRSHLVCEEKRPCHRCVKRGIADRCVDPPQEAHLLQDGSGPASAETGSSAGSVKDVLMSTPLVSTDSESAAQIHNTSSAASTGAELPSAVVGAKRKRKAKPLAPQKSSSSQRHANPIDSHTVSGRPRGAFEFQKAGPPYAPATEGIHPMPNSNESSHRSVLNSAMPVPSGPAYGSVALTMQSEPPIETKNVPSQLLHGQPIFQPPSSAELDSLFSSYFFDVADVFNSRLQADQQHPIDSSRSVSGQTTSPFHPPQQQQQQQQQQYHHSQEPQGHVQHHLSSRGMTYTSSGQPDESTVGTAHQALVSQPQHRQPPRMDINKVAPAHASANNVHSTYAYNPGAPYPVPTGERGGFDAEGPNGKEPATRLKPGDVYAPYPYRKGYASLMRYMTEQNWSEHSIKCVEAALSKVRRLWFSLEDNIQPSSMIQLQAEWAGNVRYFSESVLPFTPVPMVVCRKAGEVYASNQLAQDLCGRSKDQMTGGKLSCYELMTESSASKFFRLYELAVGGTQAEDGSYIPAVGNTAPLYWDAEIVRPNADGSHTVLQTRGIFEMKIAPCGLPSLLVCCFVPLY